MLISQPSLDRFSQPGPKEKRYGVKVLLLLPECHVCGQEVDPRFLTTWNGIESCKYCIQEIEKETFNYDLHNHY